jgi:uncharacterized protein
LALTGPRQTGKSTLLRKLFPNYQYVTLDDPHQIAIIKRDPRLFLEEHAARLILDEIQCAPEILPHIKVLIDQNREANGQFILTSSQIFPLMAGISETLSGRIALFELLEFSWDELEKETPSRIDECFHQIHAGFYPDPAVHHVLTKNFYASYFKPI